MKQNDIFATIGAIAEKYGACVGINQHKAKVTIIYNRIGEGSVITNEISEALPNIDMDIKMTPSDLKLEVILPNMYPCINGMVG
jgi:ABC-type proline/glycine betaine transport system substrate-binding protein